MSSYGLGESMYHVGFVAKWAIENNELIIYEVGASWDYYLSVLKDYRNDYEMDVVAYSSDEALALLKENSDDFTTYKHVFKKSDNGYY